MWQQPRDPRSDKSGVEILGLKRATTTADGESGGIRGVATRARF